MYRLVVVAMYVTYSIVCPHITAAAPPTNDAASPINDAASPKNAAASPTNDAASPINDAASPKNAAASPTNGRPNGLQGFLDACFKDLAKKVTVTDGKCEIIKSTLNLVDCDRDMGTCRNTTLPRNVLQIKTVLETELEKFSKTLNTFENDLRQLQAVKDELLRRAENTTPAPTTPSESSSSSEEEEESGSAMQGDAVEDEDDYTDGVAAGCPPGWITIEGYSKCYYVAKRNEKTNWKTAKAACVKKGGKLVEIKTDAEAAILKDAVIPPLSVYDYAYVGRTKKSDTNTWVFLTNEEPVNVSLRSWNNPDEMMRHDCGCVSRDSEFNMADCVCSGVKMYFICENSV